MNDIDLLAALRATTGRDTEAAMRRVFTADEQTDQEHAEHDCHVEATEEATSPSRSGAFTVTTTCGVCGRHLLTQHDSIL